MNKKESGLEKFIENLCKSTEMFEKKEGTLPQGHTRTQICLQKILKLPLKIHNVCECMCECYIADT